MNRISNLVVISAVTLFTACQSYALWTGGAVPRHITAAWYRVNFQDCIDLCEDSRQDSMWVRVRHREDFLNALINVANDPRVPAFNRANTILRIGGTNQDRAYRYIIVTLDTLSAASDFEPNWILSLGSGYTKLPEFVYPALRQQLAQEARVHPAIIALRDIGTFRSKTILQEALAGAAPSHQRLINDAILRWRHRPERE